MNIEKMNSVLTMMIEDISGTQILPNLQNISNMLENLVSSPDPSYQQDLANHIKAFREGIERSKYDAFPPSYRQIISEIAPNIILGNNLEKEVRNIIERNQITFQIAYNEIIKMYNDINQLYSVGSNIIENLKKLKIGKEDLNVGECEIGYLIPRKEIKNDFHNFQDELQSFEFIINAFSEYVVGTKQNHELKAISSSDLLLYVAICIPVAGALAKVIDWILDAYKKILEIRKLKSELIKAGVPEENSKGIQDYTNSIMQKQINEILEMLKSEYCGIKEKGRKNELEAALSICLNRIANRIDSGYNYEIRINAIPDKKDEESEEEHKKLSDSFAIIKKVEKNITFINLEGTKVLSLPESK